MKTIIKTIIIGIIFLSIPKITYALELKSNISQSDTNKVVHIKTAKKEYDMSIKKIHDITNNRPVYSLDYEKQITKNELTRRNRIWLTLDGEKQHMTSEIIYFGYKYPNHNDEKWYVITQYLLWKNMLNESDEIYFINESHEKINIYEEEIKEIENLIKDNLTLPSFIENIERMDAPFNTELELIDENSVLESCEIALNTGKYKVLNNKLIINNLDPGETELRITKKDDIYSDGSMIYLYESADDQLLVSYGSPFTTTKAIRINVPLLDVTLQIDNKYQTAKKGFKYELESEEKPWIYKTIELDDNGKSSLKLEATGKYYLREIDVPYGYEKNENAIELNITDNNQIINIEPKPIMKNLKLYTYLLKGSDKELDKNVTYEIYQKDKLIESIKSNDEGFINLALPYGSYTLKETSGNNTYNLGKISIEVDENTPEDIEVINSKKSSSSSKSSEKKYELYDSQNNFLKNIEINSFGYLDFSNLKVGTYYIKGLNTELQAIEIKKYITPRIKVTDYESNLAKNVGSLVIEKINGSNNTVLTDYKFGLYDKNKNLIKELITNRTPGIAEVKDLEPGTYYIRELSSHSKELKSDLEIEIKAGIETFVSINPNLKIKVPKTGINEIPLSSIISLGLLSLGIILNVKKH